MNDDFLKQLRAEPPPAFRNELGKRLKHQRHSGVSNSQGELVMTTSNKLPTAPHTPGRWRMLMWGMLAVGAAGAIFMLGVVLGQITPQPSVGTAASLSAASAVASVQPAAAASAFSTTPASADALAAIDLDALLTQDDLLPTGFAVLGQPSKGVPDSLRNVPEPVQVRAATLTLSGVSAGEVTVLLYETVAERDAAEAEMMRRVFAFGIEFDPEEVPSDYPIPSPQLIAGVGERATLRSGGDMTFTENSSTETAVVKFVFVRCGAAVQVRITAPTADDLAEAATEIAQTLDQQLAPQVCQAP